MDTNEPFTANMVRLEAERAEMEARGVDLSPFDSAVYRALESGEPGTNSTDAMVAHMQLVRAKAYRPAAIAGPVSLWMGIRAEAGHDASREATLEWLQMRGEDLGGGVWSVLTSLTHGA